MNILIDHRFDFIKGQDWELTNTLLFHMTEEILTRSIIQAITSSRYGWNNAIHLGKDRISVGAIFIPLVTVED